MRCSSNTHSETDRVDNDAVSALSRDHYRDLNLTIENIPIGQVKNYARNARKHPKAQIEKIAGSIEAFGFVAPLTVEEDGTLIAGHGRLAAAKMLSRKTVPMVLVST